MLLQPARLGVTSTALIVRVCEIDERNAVVKMLCDGPYFRFGTRTVHVVLDWEVTKNNR